MWIKAQPYTFLRRREGFGHRYILPCHAVDALEGSVLWKCEYQSAVAIVNVVFTYSPVIDMGGFDKSQTIHAVYIWSKRSERVRDISASFPARDIIYVWLFFHYSPDPLVLVAWKCTKLTSVVFLGHKYYQENLLAIARLRGSTLKLLVFAKNDITSEYESWHRVQSIVQVSISILVADKYFLYP